MISSTIDFAFSLATEVVGTFGNLALAAALALAAIKGGRFLVGII